MINIFVPCTCACVCAKSLQLCLTPCDPMDCSPPDSSVHGDSPGKNTWVGCHALNQGIFTTQGSNLYLLCLLHWQASSLSLVPPGKLHHIYVCVCVCIHILFHSMYIIYNLYLYCMYLYCIYVSYLIQYKEHSVNTLLTKRLILCFW